ncbi:MAG: radical SAM protein [Polyangiaceae bacterium]
MRYEGKIYRPPSEADSFILQATVGCSWNHCTYCDMYREKTFRIRETSDILEDIEGARRSFGEEVEKVFVADGDALVMPMDVWRALLHRAREAFPRLRRVSCYAMARNVLAKTQEELEELHSMGLEILYIGPESGDDITLKRIAKGDTAAAHIEAAQRAHRAGLKLSVIALLGIGSERSDEHARGTAELVTHMDPEFFSALTVTVVPGTPLHTLKTRGKFEVPDVASLLRELRVMVNEARPTRSVFRTNHASNYLPLGGTLPQDRERIVAVIDAALAGKIRLRHEASRGL